MVLTHLILNDMMKVRSHVSRLALCLLDTDPRTAALAQLFFHELSRKTFKVQIASTPFRSCSFGAISLAPAFSCSMTALGNVIDAVTSCQRILPEIGRNHRREAIISKPGMPCYLEYEKVPDCCT